MGLTADLHELFLIDQQVRGLSRGLDAAGAHLRAQNKKLDQLNNQLNELIAQLNHARASAADFENEAAAANDRIDKLREQMNAATTNREYSALLVEINTLKVDRGKIEERALEQMTKVEELGAGAEQMKAQVAEQEKLKVLAEQKLEARRAEVGDQLDQVRAKRESAARSIPQQPLAVFEKLSDATDGEALAEVTREDPRSDYTCGGCYMALPMERVNLLATTDNLIRCPSCSRILFLPTETRAALSGK